MRGCRVVGSRVEEELAGVIARDVEFVVAGRRSEEPANESLSKPVGVAELGVLDA